VTVFKGLGATVFKELGIAGLVDGRAVELPVGLAAAIKLGELTVGEVVALLQLIKTREMTARKLIPSFKSKPERFARKENIIKSPY
jgi:hypothetical protein